MSKAPRTAKAAVGMVDDRLFSIWRGRNQSRRRQSSGGKDERNRIDKWREWCARISQENDNWTNLHALALRIVEEIWERYRQEILTHEEKAREGEIVRLTQEIAMEIPRLGEERIRNGYQSRPVSQFRAVAKSPRDNRIALRTLDRSISIVFGEDFTPSTNDEAREALAKRWRDFCTRYSRKSGEEV